MGKSDLGRVEKKKHTIHCLTQNNQFKKEKAPQVSDMNIGNEMKFR